MPKYAQCWLGQANPSVSMRLEAPRRLLTSGQGRTRTGPSPAPDGAAEPSRQAGQSSGERGFSRRWDVLRLAPPREEEGRRGSQSRRQSSARKKRKKNTSKYKKTCRPIITLAA